MDIIIEGSKVSVSYDDYARLRGFNNMNELLTRIFDKDFSVYNDSFVDTLKRFIIRYEIDQAADGHVISD